MFLTGDRPFAGIRRHLRQFLMVKLPEGKQVHFRVYESVPTCTVVELCTFFGPIDYFLMEDEKRAAALRFAPGVVGPLAPNRAAALPTP